MKRLSVIAVGWALCLAGYASAQESAVAQTDKTSTRDSVKIAHRFYLIGDAGNAEPGAMPTPLTRMSQALQAETLPATVLFLGDNCYPAGLPKKDNPRREKAEFRLNAQIEAVKNFKGKVVFIPGNHDWYSNGVKGLRREEDFIKDRLGNKSFMPSDGCPLTTFNVGDDIVVIVVDSQWYITDWDADPNLNKGCDINTRKRFVEEFLHEIRKARGKTTIVALHHPMFTNGPHGGYYGAKSHLLPAPVLGSLFTVLRRTSGLSEADLQYKYYRELQQFLTAAAQQNDRVVFVSGHEHNLQYIFKDNLRQIVSGAGSKSSPVPKNVGSDFAAAAPGYAVLDIREDGSAHLEFVKSDTNEVLFGQNILEAPLPQTTQAVTEPIPSNVKAQIYSTAETTKGPTYRFLWGERFRKLYGEAVEADIANLDTLLGGLEPFRMGGGNQSRSLFLRSSSGREYVIRALRKSATQYLQSSVFKKQYIQDKLSGTKVEALVNDVFTGSYPYAPIVVSELSEAAGLPHFHPRILYVPKQSRLGRFNAQFGDELCLLEERSEPDGMEKGSGYTGESIGTYDVLEKIQKDRKSRIDEETYIRTRLFDMLIGDWDRHQDQWRWLEMKQPDGTKFVPLARDRDQAFSRMSDGFLLGAAVRLIPAAKLLRKYEGNLWDVKGFNREAYPLDVAFCVTSDEAVWQQQAERLQQALTDDVIDGAFETLPAGADTDSRTLLKQLLKERRGHLKEIAKRYYEVVARVKVVSGSEKADVFRVTCDPSGKVEVALSRANATDGAAPAVQLIADPKQTKEIWLYGLDGDDRFDVTGTPSSIRIRMIGGRDEDTYKVDNAKNIRIYDYASEKNAATNARILQTDKYEVNVYDLYKIRTATNQLIPTLGFNPDDGLRIGLTDTYTRYGFQHNPFSEQHSLRANVFFATGGFEASYRLEVANVIGATNFQLRAGIQSPNFTNNFFGYGNRSENPDDERGMDYNRVRIRNAYVSPGLVRRGRLDTTVEVGLTAERFTIENTSGRLVETYFAGQPDVFESKTFVGANALFRYENVDNKAYPTLGIMAALEGGFRKSVEGPQKDITYIIPTLSIDHRLVPSGDLVLATLLKAKVNFNNAYELYQAASIGGIDGLRGYRNQRFTGKSSFYQNTDLRYSFRQVRTDILPVRYGLFAGFDYGRVWLDGEHSREWHTSAGGGFFLNGSELISAQIGLFNGDDGNRLAFSLGFTF
ncbi:MULTISPECIES: metallophosphoesterase [unclassified Flavobacterium]|uniref:metallophosphoesterase n=1 Tax=unclassified Flavobacterium TaxID=196869 RepID=UPI001F13B11C|nr:MULTISPECIES: metallophosphoesterase [unclassified Flavobacterium]UMY65250.1 metallophosphoesterase [Flavobacterium sp. HJ-32-4]